MSSSAPGSAQVPIDTRKKTSVEGSEDSPEKDDAADDVEVDGQVCDICGDVGYENLLAVCTQCGEGAEHVYCMQKTLEEKPEVWLCEACKKIQRENPSKQAEWQASQSTVRSLSRSVSVTSSRKAVGPGSSRSRIGARLDKKRSGRRAVKGVPGTQSLPMKRPVEEATVGPAAKRTALEGSLGTGHVKGIEDLPASSIKGALVDTGSSPGRASKVPEDSGSSNKVLHGGNADIQLKRPIDDSAAGPAAKRPALGLGASLSGSFTGRGTLQTGKVAESGKIRFISPPVSGVGTPGARGGAKPLLLPESPVLPSPRTNYKAPSQRGSYTAGSSVSSEADKPSNAKGSGNLKAGGDAIPSFLLPNKTDLQWKGDISANRNKDGSTKGAGQPQLPARHAYAAPPRGVTDVSSAIASAKLVKAGRPLSSGSELRTRPESSSRAWPPTDGMTPPPQKPNKTLIKSQSDLSAQRNQVTKVGSVGKGSSQGMSEEKPGAGASTAKKLQEKSSTVQNHSEAAGSEDVASAQRSSHEDNLPCNSFQELDDKQPVSTSPTLLQAGIVETALPRRTLDLNGSFDLNSADDKISDALDMVEHRPPAPGVDEQGDGVSGAPAKTICLQEIGEGKVPAAADTQCIKGEPFSVVCSARLKSNSRRELGERELPSPVSSPGTKDGGAAELGGLVTLPFLANRNETLIPVESGLLSSCFPDQRAPKDSSTGNRSLKMASPIDSATQKLDSRSMPERDNETLSIPSKLTVVANGGDSKKRGRLPMLDLNVAAPNTDSDSEEQQPANNNLTPYAELRGLSPISELKGSPTEKITGTEGGSLSIVAVLKEHLTEDLLRRVEEVPDLVRSKEKQVLSRSLSNPKGEGRPVEQLEGLPIRDKVSDHPSELHVFGAKTSDSLTKAVAGSSIEMADLGQLPREHSQKASVVKSHQLSSTLQDSKSTLWPLDPPQTEKASLPFSVKPNERSGATTVLSSVLTIDDSTGRLGSQRSQGAKSPAMPQGIVWRGGFDVAMKEKAIPSFGIMDAYISSKAVARVYEVAKKLPGTLQLEEARRGIDSDSWPKQFQKTPPDDESIALYFFAPDVESYEKYYKRLLDRMVTHDLVLRGSVVEGAELLVISSHLLPEQFQRKEDNQTDQNQRMFMWGVFRAKKSQGASSASSEPSSAKQGSTKHLSTTSGDVAIGPVSRLALGSTHTVLGPVAMGIGRPVLPPSEYPPLPLEPPPDPPPPPPPHPH